MINEEIKKMMNVLKAGTQIDIKKSKSTNSTYVLAEKDSIVYSMGFSDHYSYTHSIDTDEENVISDEDYYYLVDYLAGNYGFKANLTYIGIKTAERYTEVPVSKGDYISERAFAQQACEVESAKLVKDNQILEVFYKNQTEPELYVNYIPTAVNAYDLINSLVKQRWIDYSYSENEYYEAFTSEALKINLEDFKGDLDDDEEFNMNDFSSDLKESDLDKYDYFITYSNIDSHEMYDYVVGITKSKLNDIGNLILTYNM